MVYKPHPGLPAPSDPVTAPAKGPGAVLFDLDGTLADTLADLQGALGTVLPEADPARMSREALLPYVSRGSKAMIRFAAGQAIPPGELCAYRERLLQAYRHRITRRTRLYPHIKPLLAALQARGLPWGVVTNKQSRLTLPLLAGLNLAHRAACIVSGDTASRAKPYPDPLLHACRMLHIEPQRCLYLGDARQDIQAGNRAGMGTLVALWGYIGPDDDPATWGADALLQAPLELLTLI